MEEKMIKKIEICCFQSHKRSVLKLTPGVNVIVGPSDSGKSAIFRALNWCINNKPQGEAFRSYWGGKTSCSIEFSDGSFVQREKDKEHVYTTIDEDDNEETFKAFKTDVPEEVKKILNIDDVNCQMQHDRPYLLSNSSGDVAKVINKIANLSDIDETISNVRKRTLQVSREVQTLTQLQAEYEEQLLAYKDLVKREKAVKAYEDLNEAVKSVSKDITEVENSIVLVEKYKRQLEEIESFLKCEKRVSMLMKKYETLKECEKDIKVLYSLIQTIENAKVEISSYSGLIEIEKKANEIIKKEKRLETINSQLTQLERLIIQIDTCRNSAENNEHKVTESEKELKKLTKGKCLLCGK